jgi:hypothetical protein
MGDKIRGAGMKIEITIDYVPEEPDEFKEWCRKNGFEQLASQRRAWCNEFNSYLRGAIGIGETKSDERFLLYKEDLEVKV